MSPERARALLLELTAVPTAAGREDAVVRFVRAWAARRKRIRLEEDAAGNLVLRAAAEAASAAEASDAGPVYLVAHTDHPAAVVTAVDAGGKKVEAAFRGGVRPGFMDSAAVRLHRAEGARTQSGSETKPRGRVTRVTPGVDAGGPRPCDPTLEVAFARASGAQPGDVLTWDLGGSIVRGGRLHAPACDDLAGVAAALATLDAVAGRRAAAGVAPLRVLLTRAEEVGFVGAVAACELGTLPADARVVVLECSKASADAPIGGGPVVRVGDRSSTFDPRLTGAVAAAAAAEEAAHPGFAWQRKLMTGGTCEATAYAAWGFASTCVCLPLGNYHNMSDDTGGKLEREVIALRDFDGMVRLLKRLPAALAGDGVAGGGLKDRLTAIHASRTDLLRRIPR